MEAERGRGVSGVWAPRLSPHGPPPLESALSRSHAWLLTSKSQPWTCEGRGAPVPSRGSHSPRAPPPGLAPTSEVTRRPCEVCPLCHVTGLRAARLCAAAEPPSPARQHPVCTRLPPTRPPGAAAGFKPAPVRAAPRAGEPHAGPEPRGGKRWLFFFKPEMWTGLSQTQRRADGDRGAGRGCEDGPAGRCFVGLGRQGCGAGVGAEVSGSLQSQGPGLARHCRHGPLPVTARWQRLGPDLRELLEEGEHSSGPPFTQHIGCRSVLRHLLGVPPWPHRGRGAGANKDPVLETQTGLTAPDLGTGALVSRGCCNDLPRT